MEYIPTFTQQMAQKHMGVYIYILRYCSYHKIQWRYTDLVNSSMASRWEMPRTMLRNGGSNAGKIVTLW